MTAQITLNPVDRLEILTAMDNVVDVLLRSTDVAKRVEAAGRERLPFVEAPLLESGRAADAPVAEHGLSFLVSVTLAERRRTILFDTGSTVGGLVHNLRMLGIDRVYAVLGGFHLAPPAFEPNIWPTVEALAEFGPQVVVPAHCTGWRATHALAAALPAAFIQGSVGTRYILQGGSG